MRESIFSLLIEKRNTKRDTLWWQGENANRRWFEDGFGHWTVSGVQLSCQASELTVRMDTMNATADQSSWSTRSPAT